MTTALILGALALLSGFCLALWLVAVIHGRPRIEDRDLYGRTE